VRLCEVILRRTGYGLEERLAAGRALDGLDLAMVGTRAADAELTGRLAGELDAEVVALTDPDGTGAALDAGADALELAVPVSDGRLAAVDATREDAFDRARSAVDEARDAGVRAQLRLVDAFRTDAAELAPAFERFEVPVVLADSPGARTPSYVAGYLRTLAELAVDLERVGVAFRDDLGVATANALVGASMGVDRVDVSVAGLAGRAGSPALEEVVVAAGAEDHAVGVDADRLIPASREALAALGETVDDRKPVLGGTVHSHDGGVDAAAMLGDPAAFEAYDPGRYGGSRTLRFGAGTDSDGARILLAAADREPTDRRVETLLARLAEAGPLGPEDAVELAAKLE
jgi:isopropylmalate/homocitrate/citramalate synthase